MHMSQRNSKQPVAAPSAPGTPPAPGSTNWETPYQGVDSLIKGAMDQVQQGFDALKQAIVNSSGGPVAPAQATDLAGQWFADVPELARASADALTTASTLFSGLP